MQNLQNKNSIWLMDYLCDIQTKRKKEAEKNVSKINKYQLECNVDTAKRRCFDCFLSLISVDINQWMLLCYSKPNFREFNQSPPTIFLWLFLQLELVIMGYNIWSDTDLSGFSDHFQATLDIVAINWIYSNLLGF